MDKIPGIYCHQYATFVRYSTIEESIQTVERFRKKNKDDPYRWISGFFVPYDDSVPCSIDETLID